MTREEFDEYCSKLKATTNVIQWGGSSVWKVGGKIFAICSIWGEGHEDKISFKCADMSFDILCELPGIIPAPYLARGKWVQLAEPDALSDDDICSYIADAHMIIAGKLSKAKQRELGLLN